MNDDEGWLCEDCGEGLNLFEGSEWPDGVPLCWGCLWERYAEAQRQVERLEGALDEERGRNQKENPGVAGR